MAQPPDYSGYYYRPGEGPGGQNDAADRLQALADGYFGLNWAFLANVVMAIGFNVARVATGDTEAGIIVVLGGLVFLFVAVTAITYRYNLRIAAGKGWNPAAAALASVLMGLNSVLCCGIIGYVVMQQIAYAEMKRYGIRPALLGVRKKDVEARIRSLRDEASAAPNAPPPPSFQA